MTSDVWKAAQLLNSGDPSDLNIHRPTSKPQDLTKVLEALMNNELKTALAKLAYKMISGYR